jgi:hypothetical protein
VDESVQDERPRLPAWAKDKGLAFEDLFGLDTTLVKGPVPASEVRGNPSFSQLTSPVRVGLRNRKDPGDYPWLPLVRIERPYRPNLHRAIVWLRLESGERLSLRDICAIVGTSLGNCHNQLALHPSGKPCDVCGEATILNTSSMNIHLPQRGSPSSSSSPEIQDLNKSRPDLDCPSRQPESPLS